MTRKIIVASAGAEEAPVHGGDAGKFNLMGVAEQFGDTYNLRDQTDSTVFKGAL